jgi:hypothetical protein
MFDNGAFSAFTKGKVFNEAGYYAWIEPRLGHPHWAVVPDVIDGSVDDQRERVARWPFHQWLGAPVWHVALPIDYLMELADSWPRICFGSSGAFWQVGSEAWQRRADEAFNALARRHRHLPWIHMLRGLNLVGDRWPFASADSVNVARNFKCRNTCPDRMARNIDARQSSVRWNIRPEQLNLV